MCVQKYRARPREVEAIQFKLGTSTKSELMRFCPGANIGVTEHGETDIRWFTAPAGIGGEHIDIEDGDWIVNVAPGYYSLFDTEGFEATYEKAYSFRGDDD